MPEVVFKLPNSVAVGVSSTRVARNEHQEASHG
jgi:hypothetical protein